MEEYVGIIKPFAGTFAPQGWVLCDGSSLPISQYQTVYTIIGTTFGGDGQTSFNVPDLRGVVPMGTTPNYSLGDRVGSEFVILTMDNLPTHSHSLTGGLQVMANVDHAETADPKGAYPAIEETNGYATTGDAPMGALRNTLATTPMGNPAKIDNRTPYTVITYIMCVEGIYPPRN